uniref:CDK-activating kinase assembly factor MAT1 n=1 Tax=Eubosmina coregoni TaxID=186181 RepID=A0A4Y7LM32_9CRUS|nr:EOG090X0BPM [Eubosmina coregoni]SVE70010.1 EOG090X0BPM [Eubosmina coregoni]
MDDLTCPRCKTTKYRKPDMVLMVNVCGHALCQECVEQIYVKGSGNCLECSYPLKKSNFRVQMFEDSNVDKEVSIRRKVLKDFNKTREDFEELKDYNDYLEEVETIIFNLVFDKDIINTSKMIDTYKKENKDLIMRNQNKFKQDIEEMDEQLALEKQNQQEKSKMFNTAELEEKKQKAKAREKLIDELMFSNTDAKAIVASHAQSLAAVAAVKQELEKKPVAVKANQFSTGVQIGVRSSNTFLPLPKQADIPLYSYTRPVFDYNGPEPPLIERLGSLNYFTNIRAASVMERAGGYTEALSCCRALQEAMGGLFYSAKSTRNLPLNDTDMD